MASAGLVKYLGGQAHAIRMTPDGKQASVIDLIGVICFLDNANKLTSNAADKASVYWNRLRREHEHVGALSMDFKFKGRGQRYTPVMLLEQLPLLIRKLVCKMRRSMKWKREMLAAYGCSTEDVDLEARVFVEAEIMPHLIKAFAACDPRPQFSIGPYRIDLYLAKPKIAVECDENGHSGYDRLAEASRESLIKQALGCSFVRFNPQAHGFGVSDAMAAVVKALIDKAADQGAFSSNSMSV